MAIEWGDVATWVTGVTSILLFIVAFWQIRVERSARRAAELERSIAERRDQAERIAAWIETEFPGEHAQMMCVAVSNQSLQPIYDVVVQGILLSNDGAPIADPFPENRSQLAIAPPGKGYTTFPFNYAGMHKRAGIEIAFQDAANRFWLRKTNGELAELESSPVVHYRIPLPTGWGMLLEHCPEPHEDEAEWVA
jgi:hypothetical protein